MLRGGQIRHRLGYQLAPNRCQASRERPLTDAELEHKLFNLATHACQNLDVSPLVDAICSIESESDVQQIMRRTVPEPSSRD